MVIGTTVDGRIIPSEDSITFLGYKFSKGPVFDRNKPINVYEDSANGYLKAIKEIEKLKQPK